MSPAYSRTLQANPFCLTSMATHFNVISFNPQNFIAVVKIDIYLIAGKMFNQQCDQMFRLPKVLDVGFENFYHSHFLQLNTNAGFAAIA